MEVYLTLAPVASVIFAITILVSLIAFYNENILVRFMLHPYSVSRGKRLYGLITSGFIHKDWMHLIFNMLSYYFFAFQLEVRLGHWQFGLLYMLSLILSDLPSVAKHKEDYGYHSLGASGAVSAVIFGAILFDPLNPIYIMLIPIPIYGVVFAVLYLVYCNYASKHARDNVNHDAHLFGALSGLMITIILHHQVLPEFIQIITEKVQSWRN
ncbi:MAG: rhomboid family intramembrane serine protease [Mucilaginibacter sp.]